MRLSQLRNAVLVVAGMSGAERGRKVPVRAVMMMLVGPRTVPMGQRAVHVVEAMPAELGAPAVPGRGIA